MHIPHHRYQIGCDALSALCAFFPFARDHESHIYIVNWLVTEININFNSFSTLKIGNATTDDAYSTLSNYKFVDALQTRGDCERDRRCVHSPLQFVARATSPNCLHFTQKFIYSRIFSIYLHKIRSKILVFGRFEWSNREAHARNEKSEDLTSSPDKTDSVAGAQRTPNTKYNLFIFYWKVFLILIQFK